MKSICAMILLIRITAMAQTAPVSRYAIGPVSVGTSYLSTTKVVANGTTVTQGHAVKLDNNGNVIECAVSDVEFLGIAAATVVGNGTSAVEVATRGVIAAMIENDSTTNHIAGIGTGNVGLVRDLGQASSTSISVGVKILGKFLETKSAGSTALVQLYGPGHFGAQVQGADLPAVTRIRGFGAALVSPTTSSVAYIPDVPYACTISGWTIGIVPGGSATVKVWRVADGTGLPSSGNSINTSGLQLASNTRVRSTVTSDFTSTAILAHDALAIAVTAVSGSPSELDVFVECDQ